MNNRDIGRVRMALGALLLFATVVTWATGFMMSPHGQAVVKGTEHVRTTVVTFKRNAAIGTLICCALAAWLLFPRRRRNWPARDWSVAVLIALLSGSSIYTLVSLPSSEEHGVDANDLASSNIEVNAGESAASVNPEGFNPPPLAGAYQPALPPVVARGVVAPKPQSRSSAQEPSEDGGTDEPAVTAQNGASADDSDEPAETGPENNQE